MVKKLRAGVGALATVLVKFIKPKADRGGPKDRAEVVLEEEFQDEKGRDCYKFRLAAQLPGEGQFLYANQRYCKVVEEGNADLFFDVGEGENGLIMWGKSDARRLLLKDISEGVVSDDMPPQDVYFMRPSYAAYDYEKFEKRLNDVRKIVDASKGRADEDEEALAKYIEHHSVSTHSHKGYIQWQASESQKQALDDLENKRFDLDPGTGGFRAMYNSDPLYFEEFP